MNQKRYPDGTLRPEYPYDIHTIAEFESALGSVQEAIAHVASRTCTRPLHCTYTQQIIPQAFRTLRHHARLVARRLPA